MWFGRTLELNLNWIQLKTLWKHFWLLTIRSEVMKIGNILYPPLFLNIGSRLRCQLLLWQQPVYKHQNKEGDNDLKREKGRHPPIHSTKVGKVSSLKFLGIHVSLHAVPCRDSEGSSTSWRDYYFPPHSSKALQRVASSTSMDQPRHLIRLLVNPAVLSDNSTDLPQEVTTESPSFCIPCLRTFSSPISHSFLCIWY